MAHDSEPLKREGPVRDEIVRDDLVPDDFSADGLSLAAVRALRHVLDPSGGRSARRDATASFDGMMHSKATGERGTNRQWAGLGRALGKQPIRLRPSFIVGTLVLAIFAIVGSIGGNSWTRFSHSFSQRSTPAHEYVSGPTQIQIITLTDGSRVMLAPRSRLVLAPNFGRVARAVTLSGEAYFDVIANPNIPFSVRTGNVLTNVLGTKFDVRHDTVDGRVYVAVETGRVRSKGGSAIITLAAGSVGVVTDSTAIVTTTNASGFSPWQNGDLVFDNTPVPVVLTRVGRLYGYTFVLADSTLNDSRITTTLPVTESAETIQAILDLLDVTMTTRDSTITLHTIPRMRQNKFRERRQMLNHGVSHTEVGR